MKSRLYSSNTYAGPLPPNIEESETKFVDLWYQTGDREYLRNKLRLRSLAESEILIVLKTKFLLDDINSRGPVESMYLKDYGERLQEYLDNSSYLRESVNGQLPLDQNIDSVRVNVETRKAMEDVGYTTSLYIHIVYIEFVPIDDEDNTYQMISRGVNIKFNIRDMDVM